MIRMPTRTTGAAFIVILLGLIVVVVVGSPISCYKRDIPVGFLLPTPFVAGHGSGRCSRRDVHRTIRIGFILPVSSASRT